MNQLISKQEFIVSAATGAVFGLVGYFVTKAIYRRIT